MNKTKNTIVFFISLFSFAQGENLNKTELRAAAFFPMNQTFREVYGDVGISLQVEQARDFKNVEHLEAWGNFEWIFFNGDRHRSCGSSHIDMFNFSLGVKGIGNVYRDWIYMYAGIGPDVGFTHIRNRLKCCDDCEEVKKSNDWNVGIGVIGKTGAQLFFNRHFFLDFFADYLYLPIHFSKTEDVGGFKLGGGLSYRY